MVRSPLGWLSAAAMAVLGRRRRSDEYVIGHPLRARLLEIVKRDPGPNISELCRLVGAKWGTVQYHLALLERAGLLSRISEGRDQRLFAGKAPSAEARQIAVLRRGRVEALVRAVLRRPGLRQRDLAETVSISRKVLRSYVDALTRCGLIQEVRESNSCLYYPTQSLQLILTKVQAPESGPPAEGHDRRD